MVIVVPVHYIFAQLLYAPVRIIGLEYSHETLHLGDSKDDFNSGSINW
jgi:hypothetical protein